MPRPRGAEESLSNPGVAELGELPQAISSTSDETEPTAVKNAQLCSRAESPTHISSALPCASSLRCPEGLAAEPRAQTEHQNSGHLQTSAYTGGGRVLPRLDQNGDMLLSGEDVPASSDGSVKPSSAESFRICSSDEHVLQLNVRDMRYPCSWMTLIDPEPIRGRVASAEQNEQILVIQAAQVQGKWFALDPQLLLALKIVDTGRKTRLAVGVDVVDPPASLVCQVDQGLSGLYVRLMY